MKFEIQKLLGIICIFYFIGVAVNPLFPKLTIDSFTRKIGIRQKWEMFAMKSPSSIATISVIDADRNLLISTIRGQVGFKPTLKNKVFESWHQLLNCRHCTLSRVLKSFCVDNQISKLMIVLQVYERDKFGTIQKNYKKESVILCVQEK